MKLKKKYHMTAILMVLLFLIIVLVFHRNKQQTLTSYQTADGWIYECSQPVKAKNGTSQALKHPQGLVPVDDSEAAQYCHRVGIE